jgi:hypothetical protein
MQTAIKSEREMRWDKDKRNEFLYNRCVNYSKIGRFVVCEGYIQKFPDWVGKEI